MIMLTMKILLIISVTKMFSIFIGRKCPCKAKADEDLKEPNNSCQRHRLKLCVEIKLGSRTQRYAKHFNVA